MRTSIVIDPKLMDEALRLSGARTKRQVIAESLRLLIQVKRQAQVDGRLRAAIVLMMAGLLVGCVSRPERGLAIGDRESERAFAELTQRTDANSLAAAGLLSLVKHRDQAVELFARAVAAQPGRADLVWLEARSCEQAPACDPGPIEQRLRMLDPTNGAGWLYALARADSREDNDAKQSALAAIARSKRVDIYWTRLIAELSPALARTRAMSLGEAERSVIGILAAVGIPAYRIVSDTCRSELPPDVELTKMCRAIANAFERGDTYITAMVGDSIALKVWPEQSAEWRAAREARVAFQHRSKLLMALERHRPNSQAARGYLALCAQNRREQDVVRAQLVQAGLRPDPPEVERGGR